MNRKEAYSLSSKIFNVVCLIFGYYFLATPLFYKLEKRLVDGVPTTLKYQLSGYQLLSSDDLYVTLIIILFLTILSFAVIFFIYQLMAKRDMFISSYITLGSLIIAFEFLSGVFTFNGYLFMAVLLMDFIQFFIFNKKKEVHYWTFFGIIALALAILPSAIAVSKMIGL